MKRKYLACLVAAAMLLTVLGAPAEEPALTAGEETGGIIVENTVESPVLPEQEPAPEPDAGEVPAEEPAGEVTALEVPAEVPAEEPVVEETPAEVPAEEPVVEEVLAEEPAEEPVVEEVPAEQPAEEPVVEEVPADVPAEEPIVKETPAEVPAEEPVVEEVPAEVPAEEPVVEEVPAEVPAEEPVVEEVPAEEPAEEVIVEEPATEAEPPVVTPEELEAGGEPIPTGTQGPEESPLPEEPSPAPAEPTPDPDVTLAPEETFAYVVPAGSLSIGSTRLELRAAPDASSALLAVIDPGAYVRLLGESGSWAHIEYEGLNGYVDRDNVVVDAPVFDPDSLSIRIWYTNEPDKVHYGDVLTMRGLLVGFENLEYEYALVWQRATMNRDRSVQGDWKDIPGADSLTYSFTVDKDTEWAAWRLIARVRVPASEAAAP